MADINYKQLALMFMMGSKGVSALSDSAQAGADKATGTYNAGVLSNRANLSKVQQQWAYYNMDVIRKQGEIKKRQLTEGFKKTRSDIKTTKGISSTSPTIIAIIEESAQEYLYDLALVDWDTDLQVLSEERTAWAKGVEAESHKQDAKWQEYVARVNSRQSSANKWGSLLTSGAQMFSMIGGMSGPTPTPTPTPTYASSMAHPRFGG